MDSDQIEEMITQIEDGLDQRIGLNWSISNLHTRDQVWITIGKPSKVVESWVKLVADRIIDKYKDDWDVKYYEYEYKGESEIVVYCPQITIRKKGL